MAPNSELNGEVWLVRHGETEWSLSGQHTSVTDKPLTDGGIEQAKALGERLADRTFALELTSPRSRARHTAELTGHGDAEVTEDLAEWAYGDYEGMTTLQIRESVPGWTLWTHGPKGGESAESVTERLDRVVERAHQTDGNVLLFAHGHSLRAFAARWIGLPVTDGRLLRLDTATLSVLGYERETPVVLRWNS